MKTIDKLRLRARQLGFPPLQPVEGRSTIVDLIPAKSRTGIYILKFKTGEAYVGLSIDVVQRFTQHRLTHPDIEWFTSKRVPKSKLSEEELRCIGNIERAGFKLRNIAFASTPPSVCDLDEVVPRKVQERYIASGIAASGIADVPVAKDLRRKYMRKFGELMAHPLGLHAVELFATYLRGAILAPLQTQISFWGVSALPGRRVLLRVNINWQEVLTIYSRKDTLSVSLHIARAPLETGFGRSLDALSASLPGVKVDGHRYATGGMDQVHLDVPADLFEGTFNVTPVLRGVREMNLRLMRKGATPWGRNHCPQLVDLAVRLRPLAAATGVHP